MSLILRKEAQVILDTGDLHNYHAMINPNKYLAIVGECGKPLFTIKGVVFVNHSPTKAEIAFAIELLGDFLATHKLDIDNLFAAKNQLANATQPKVPSGFIYTTGQLSTSNSEITLKLDAKQNFRLHTDYREFPLLDSLLIKKYLSSAFQKKMQNILKGQDDYAALVKAVIAATTKFNTCNI